MLSLNKYKLNYWTLLQSGCELRAGIIMFVYVSVQLLLLTWCFSTISAARNKGNHDVRIRSSTTVPKCTVSDYVYDPLAHACVQKHSRVHCGENMAFKTAGQSGAGSCVCWSERGIYDRRDPPQIRSSNGTICWNLGQRVSPYMQSHY